MNGVVYNNPNDIIGTITWRDSERWLRFDDDDKAETYGQNNTGAGVDGNTMSGDRVFGFDGEKRRMRHWPDETLPVFMSDKTSPLPFAKDINPVAGDSNMPGKTGKNGVSPPGVQNNISGKTTGSQQNANAGTGPDAGTGSTGGTGPDAGDASLPARSGETKDVWEQLSENARQALLEEGITPEIYRKSMTFDPESRKPRLQQFFEATQAKPQIDEKKLKRARTWSSIADALSLIAQAAGAAGGATIANRGYDQTASGKAEKVEQGERDKYNQLLKEYNQGLGNAMKDDVNLSYKEWSDNRARIINALSERSKERFRSALEDKKISAREKQYATKLEKDLEKLQELYKRKNELEMVQHKNRKDIQAQKDLEATKRELIKIKAGMDMKGLALANDIELENQKEAIRRSGVSWNLENLTDLDRSSKGDFNKPSPVPGVDMETYKWMVEEKYSDRQIAEYGKNPQTFAEEPEGRGASAGRSADKDKAAEDEAEDEFSMYKIN